MRFSAILIAVSIFAGNAFATEEDKSQLHAGFSPAFEQALIQEFGPVTFEALKSLRCPKVKCLIDVGKSTKCILKCIKKKKEDIPACISKCIPIKKASLCACKDCYPQVIRDVIRKLGLCKDDIEAELFAKLYLGIADEEEKKLAEELSISQEVPHLEL